jgi:hypothetical protein
LPGGVDFGPVLPYVVGMKIDSFSILRKAKAELVHTRKMLKESNCPKMRQLLKEHEGRLMAELEKHETVSFDKRWRFINRFAD